MLANMACSLIEHKRINTTEAKAKALRQYVEPLITKSKNDTTHNRRIVFSHGLLYPQCALNRIDRTWKFDQQAVARGLYQSSVVSGDCRVDQFGTHGLEAPERLLPVRVLQVQDDASLPSVRREEQCAVVTPEGRPPCTSPLP